MREDENPYRPPRDKSWRAREPGSIVVHSVVSLLAYCATTIVYSIASPLAPNVAAIDAIGPSLAVTAVAIGTLQLKRTNLRWIVAFILSGATMVGAMSISAPIIIVFDLMPETYTHDPWRAERIGINLLVFTVLVALVYRTRTVSLR